MDPYNNAGAAGIVNGYSVKTCYYFNKGHCRYGSNCRFYHGQVAPPQSFSQMNGNSGYDQGVLPDSLAQLEADLIELLRSNRGSSVSIASLRRLYFEKYNRVLQADGYLTERQRHGKSGYSLSKLLALLKNSIRLIDKPNGQHEVVLVEDRHLEKGDPRQNISASRQLYMTFLPGSSFTEQDVSDYFNSFGQVEDVRIPPLQRRMFGFITFVDPETVKLILEKQIAHNVCGSSVLVKPYQDKSKRMDRKHLGRAQPPVVCSPRYVELAPNEFVPSYGNPAFLRRQQEQVFEFQRRQHLSELQLTQKHLSTSPHFGSSSGQVNVSGHVNVSEFINYAMNDKIGHIDHSFAETSYRDQPENFSYFHFQSGIDQK
ncbi:hypothetical protein QN277_016211 [Acacia crassicarpa]|uniref:Uncharacterized protein n=1 Tax=Acacia crassicarpa TaxID=499986 RepID=A0AAE1MW53_9FABA|nr:hypothetical protein QN277_016211 [Acacia crassicarpa]